jgi:alanine dehydrogenase
VLSSTDDDVTGVTAERAVAIMREALRAHHHGDLESPVRFGVDLRSGGFTFTAGRLAGVASGFRLGSTVVGEAQELTLVLDPTGSVVGVVTGREIGRRRTGALGGVAADVCARAEATTIGLVGAGHQAFTQLWAIAAVRPLRRIRVFTRSAAHAREFAIRVDAQLGLAVEVVTDPRRAVSETDIVVLATPAPEPLIEASWVSPGTHVHTLGPKGPAEGECPRSLARDADLLVSDSPAQLVAMEGPARPWTAGRPATALGSVVAGVASGRTSSSDITCYASVGLAGTEVLLAREVLSRFLPSSAPTPSIPQEI